MWKCGLIYHLLELLIWLKYFHISNFGKTSVKPFFNYYFGQETYLCYSISVTLHSNYVLFSNLPLFFEFVTERLLVQQLFVISVRKWGGICFVDLEIYINDFSVDYFINPEYLHVCKKDMSTYHANFCIQCTYVLDLF